MKIHKLLHKLYLRGIAVGLAISWVTGVLAYYLRGAKNVSVQYIFVYLMELEIILSVIFLILSFFVKD